MREKHRCLSPSPHPLPSREGSVDVCMIKSMKERYYLLIIFLGLFLAVGARADSHLLISQIQLAGETSTDEFVEIFNPADAAVTIADWKLVKKTSSGSQSNLVSAFQAGMIIGPRKYFLITHKTGYLGGVTADTTYSGSSYSVAANNAVILLDASGTIVDKVGFGEASDFEGASAVNPEAGQSLKRSGWESGAVQDTDNNLADFTVGASSPRNSSWGGVYIPPAQSNQSTTSSQLLDNGNPTDYRYPTVQNFEKGQLLINEVYPVADTGEKEWIEIFNPGSAAVSLDGWTMEDGRDLIASLYGSILKYSAWEITPARLNNDGDTIKLKSPNGQIIDIVSYGKMSSSTPTLRPGESLARKIDGFNSGSVSDFVITQTPTMGEKNIITAAAEADVVSEDNGEPAASSTPATAKSKTTTKKLTGAVSANGIVLVSPGTFALTYFYILKDDGSAMQIYGAKKEYFPQLTVGDYIYVYGAMGSIAGEERIKVKAGGIKKMGKKDLPTPDEISLDELDEEATGFVRVSGEITEKKSAGMYLDDGAGEIYVNLKKKANINTRDILSGNKVEITGVLISNNKGLSLLPRSNDDIKKSDAGTVAAPKDASALLKILKYVLPTMAALGLGVAVYFWRVKKKLIFEGSEIVEEKMEINPPALDGRG